MGNNVRAVEIEGTIKYINTRQDGSVDLTISLTERCKPAAGQMISEDWMGEFVRGVLERASKEKESQGNYGL